MFERYTEKARRVIFFARYEASQFGRDQIEADFLLLGIAREDGRLCTQWLGANYAELRESFARIYTTGKRVPASVDLPISDEGKTVLAHAAEEAERMASRHVGTEHLFLGLLREPKCEAARMLAARGGDLAAVRAAVAAEVPRLETERKSKNSPDGVQMRLVGEDGHELGVVPWTGRLPQVGEAIGLPGKDGETVHRVDDVHWRLTGDEASGFRIREAVVKLRNAWPIP